MRISRNILRNYDLRSSPSTVYGRGTRVLPLFTPFSPSSCPSSFSILPGVTTFRYASTTSAPSPSATNPYAYVKKVVVIGGGVSGLQSARACRDAGYETILYEKEKDISGVWAKNYDGFGLQVESALYYFPDFPMTTVSPSTFPTGPEVKRYIESYAEHHQLFSLIQKETEVTEAKPFGNGWNITTRNRANNTTKTEYADFLIVSSGMYHNPFIPTYPGQDTFLKNSKQIIHSSNFVDANIAKDKNVIVVGGAKSAVDCAIEADNHKAKSSSLLFRNGHWGTPRKIAGLIPFKFIFLSRFGQALVSWYKGALPTAPGSVKATHSVLSPIMGPIFKVVEALFAFQLGLYKHRKPVMDVVKDFYGYAQVLNSDFNDKVKNKSVNAVQGEIASLTADSVELTDGTKLPCDILVAGTGFRKSYAIFGQDVQQNLNVSKDGLYLYRHILSPNVPNVAFIGSELAVISNITTYGLQAEWLVRLLQGKMTKPSKETMEAAVIEHQTWARSWMPETASRSSLVLLHQIHYNDTLLKDMKVDHRRKGMNVLAEIFAPYQPQDYNGILTYRK